MFILTKYANVKKKNNFILRKSFTLIELLVVIIIIGIIVGTLSFDFAPNRLKIATDQLVKDIRYTQSLALKDDKYQPFPDSTSAADQNKSKYWFKKRWQIKISKQSTYFVYTVFSDSNLDGSASVDESVNDAEGKKIYEYNLSKDGVVDIKYQSVSITSSISLLFDNCGNIFLNEGGTDPNPLSGTNLSTTDLNITLCKNSACNKYCEIIIVPSGYVYEENCSN